MLGDMGNIFFHLGVKNGALLQLFLLIASVEAATYNILQLMIHQIFSLMQPWSKHVAWLNIPQLKSGNI